MFSTKAEISAAIVGIGLVPERLAVEVMTDSQGLVQGFNRYIEGLQGGLSRLREQLQTRYYREWAALHGICRR